MKIPEKVIYGKPVKIPRNYDWAKMKYVVHCRKEPYDVYIGRPGPYGNPFIMGRDGSREEVVEKYREWLLGQPELIEKMKQELQGKVLGCWCKPKACHGDVILEIINA